jgi:hypothetical protein
MDITASMRVGICIVERRGELLDVGIERLCRTVTTDSPDVVCKSVMLRMIGESIPQDDIALLALRRSGNETA